VRRENRSTYRDSLVSTEKVTAGKWGPSAPNELPSVSVEQDFARELRVGLGDTITWDVQGVRVPTVVRSLRDVKWARFSTNFFLVFEPRALAGAPASWALLTRVDSAYARATLQHDAVQRYPSISAIDLTTIQSAIQDIVSKVTLAVRLLSLFSFAIGILVLVSAVVSSRRQRVREAVLLKTLGATRAQIGRILMAEYAALGALGSGTGMLLAVAGAWGVMKLVFETRLDFAPAGMLALGAGTMLLTVGVGLWSGREVFSATVSEELRD
jgi:putative ABC transport system permease protein